MENIAGFLNWMIYLGGAALVASWVLERIPQYVNQPAETKKLIAMAVTILIGLACFAVVTYVPVEVLAQLDPWFKVIAGIILAYSGQQVVHKLTKPIQ